MIIVLLIIICILVGYIYFLNKMIKNINNQIEFRMREKSRQPIIVQMFNKNLNDLCNNFNKMLKIEEGLRVESISHEQKFKEMIANISHDLRTPLTAVKGYVQFLNRSLVEDKQKETAATILNHINQLDKLINSFFELSYLEISNEKFEVRKVNLTNSVCNNVLDYIRQFEEKDMKVEFNCKQPFYVNGNEEKIKRIIQNLIKNCLVHSKGDVKVNICEEDENVVLSFKNRVKETEKINTENLFDKFYIADSSRNKATSGLGLSIVKKLCEQMNGSVEAYLNEDILDIQVTLKKYK